MHNYRAKILRHRHWKSTCVWWSGDDFTNWRNSKSLFWSSSDRHQRKPIRRRDSEQSGLAKYSQCSEKQMLTNKWAAIQKICETLGENHDSVTTVTCGRGLAKKSNHFKKVLIILNIYLLQTINNFSLKDEEYLIGQLQLLNLVYDQPFWARLGFVFMLDDGQEHQGKVHSKQ